MNKTSLIIESVLGVAVVALFVLFFTQKNQPEAAVAPAESEVAAECNHAFPIAYLRMDSLIANYDFAKNANDKLQSKQEDATVTLNTKMKALQQEVAEFQRKVENNAFLSRERYESEGKRLQKKEQDLQALEAKLGQDIMLETQQLSKQLADTIDNFLKIYNADGRYKMIIRDEANTIVLHADSTLDITADVIEALNARYNAE